MAKPRCKGRGESVCRCRDHHRRHLHLPCAVDLHVKHACVGDALTIVRRDIEACRAGRTLSDTELTHGTSYGMLESHLGCDADHAEEAAMEGADGNSDEAHAGPACVDSPGRASVSSDVA